MGDGPPHPLDVSYSKLSITNSSKTGGYGGRLLNSDVLCNGRYLPVMSSCQAGLPLCQVVNTGKPVFVWNVRDCVWFVLLALLSFSWMWYLAFLLFFFQWSMKASTWSWPVRWETAILIYTGLICNYAMRMNISIAILKVVARNKMDKV